MLRKRQRGRNQLSPDQGSGSRRSHSSGARPSTASVYYDRFAEKALKDIETSKGKKRGKIASIERVKRNSGDRKKYENKENGMDIVPKPKRTRAPIPPPAPFQNIILYLNKEGEVITRETVEGKTGLSLPKRRKRNAKMEDEIQALYVLLDPVTLEEEEYQTRNSLYRYIHAQGHPTL